MYPSVMKVAPGEDYTLIVHFDNGEVGTLDMEPRRLKSRDVFRPVRVAFDTVEWESGIDLDPDFFTKNATRRGVNSETRPIAHEATRSCHARVPWLWRASATSCSSSSGVSPKGESPWRPRRNRNAARGTPAS